MFSKKLFIYSFFLLVIGNCSKINKDASEISHPVKEYMPHFNEIIQSGKTDGINSIFPAMVSRIEQGQKLFTIGAKSGKQVEIFGDITDLATDSEENIYILDQRSTSIRKYSPEGELLTFYGGTAGRGPTDLFRPSDIALDDNDNIYVADGFNYIKILKSTENGIEYKGAIQTPKIIPSDLCILNDRLYLRTIAENKSITDSLVYNLVHVYSLEDHTYQGAFGDLYQSPRIRTNRRISGRRAKLACIESTNTIVYTFDSLGYLYGYSPEGKFKWATELVPFTGSQIEETVQGGIDVKWSFNIHGTKINSIQAFQDKHIVAQGWHTQEDSEPQLLSYILSAKNGQGIFVKQTLPYLVNINQDHFFVAKADTTISVDIFEFRD